MGVANAESSGRPGWPVSTDRHRRPDSEIERSVEERLRRKGQARETASDRAALRPRRLTTEEWDHRELLRLVESFPIGAVVRFRSYDPTIRPRDWRRVAAGAPWGLRRDDLLDVTGYAGGVGFPEGLSVRRRADGPDSPTILVFPAELQPPDTAGRPADPRRA
ncbi:MAG TPA: hypothetical protein VFX49_13535 [Chloroflexota bacterium]|nr:hypothetical protein [Chloroflexota bacterium]